MAVAAYNQVLTFWQDVDGRIRTCSYTIKDQSDAVPAGLTLLGSKLQAISNAQLIAVQLQTTHPIAGAPVDATYKTVYDVAALLGRISDGSSYPMYEIPAPKASIFLADGETVDLANVDVAAAASQMVAVLGNAAGTALGLIKRGRRQFSGPS